MKQNQPSLRDIQTFYDHYHQAREREPDAWVISHYWPNFLGKTLEIGAGTMFPDRSDYFAVDLSYNAARHASRLNIPALIANGAILPFDDRFFDTVACYDVLEHITDPQPFIHELCRLTRHHVMIAGPNYVSTQHGGLDRYLFHRLVDYLFGKGKGYQVITRPYLEFDENWYPDHDAVIQPNAGFVAEEIRSQGLKIKVLRSWEHAFGMLNYLPMIRCLGQFMFVIGERKSKRSLAASR